MISQNTFPDYFEDKKEETVVVATPEKTKEKITVEDLLKINSEKLKLEHFSDKRTVYMLGLSVVSGLLLILSGWLLINLNLWFIPLFILLFVLFVCSNIFSFLFKTNRNLIWLHLIGIGGPYFLLMIFTGSILTGTAWIGGILLLFLVFISFLELENSLNVNRIFKFKLVTSQAKKLLILAGILLTTMGAFMAIYSRSGAGFVEDTINKNEIYKTLFDPANKTAIFGRLIINEKVLKSVDGSATSNGQPLTYKDYLLERLSTSSAAIRSEFYSTFADKYTCKEGPTQTDSKCKEFLDKYTNDTLALKSINEFGIDTSSEKPGSLKLTSPMNKENVKIVIKKAYSHNIQEFVSSKNSATNPLKIYSILGKNEGVSLFISMFLFLGLLLTYFLYNILISFISNLAFNHFRKKGLIKISTATAQVEFLE
ncbi:MAG: hypothetical protein ACRCXZ_01555 [Patescibacteria group bacterium]